MVHIVKCYDYFCSTGIRNVDKLQIIFYLKIHKLLKLLIHKFDLNILRLTFYGECLLQIEKND